MNEELTGIIKKICTNAGFVKAGIAKAEKLTDESIHLEKWLDENRNADMKWINSSFEKRCNPELILENVKSVISLAYLYDTPFLHSENKNIPKISRYSWGNKDYHKVLKKKLKLVCQEIEALDKSFKTKYYVDDGPVMDKAWAVRSGIGWMGKNTNIINSDCGSFFFIANIFINTELKFDKPVEDLCGTCSLCIKACPTGAIFEEYRLDSNLCISYQTIENKKEIPDKINLNGWIFGCDICQDVCPFNTNKIFTNDVNFFPKNEFFNKTYEELLQMTEEEFNKVYEGTPVRRTKYKGWVRNLSKAKNDSESI